MTTAADWGGVDPRDGRRLQREYWRLTRKFAAEFVDETFTAGQLKAMGASRKRLSGQVADLLFGFAEAMMIDRALKVRKP